MGYQRDWDDAANAAAAAQAAHPNCTQAADCPAGDDPGVHLLTCRYYRAHLRPGR